MGPRSDGRGQVGVPEITRVVVLLQWGRDLTVADRSNSGRLTSRITCFNGAAI